MDLEEVFGYPKMYVFDGSILQANPCVNHSFSISAVSKYAMDQIPEKSNNKNISLAPPLDKTKDTFLFIRAYYCY